jgi:hypothetical protein
MPQRHIPFRTTATAAVVAALLLLSGCGSSHHDSTGPTTQNLPLTPGTYRGTLGLTVTGPGGASVSNSGPVVIVLSPSGVVQVGQFPAVSVQGNSFFTSLPYTFLNSNPQLHCTSGTIGASGTFNGPTVSGNASSSGLVCNGFPFVVTGGYTAQLSASELPRGGIDGEDVLDLMRETLERAIA